MEVKTCMKPSFTVIGKEGSTKDGKQFIQKLWQEANAHFAEVAPLAKKDAQGHFAGFWGAMSDMSRSFLPWQNHFSEGLYLAGVECDDEAEAPAGWTKWVIPGYEYLCAEVSGPETFTEMMTYLKENHISLAGAVHDFTDPKTQKNYMYFPIKRIEEAEA